MGRISKACCSLGNHQLPFSIKDITKNSSRNYLLCETRKKRFWVTVYFLFFLRVASRLAVASFFLRVTHPSFAAAERFLNSVSFDLAIILKKNDLICRF